MTTEEDQESLLDQSIKYIKSCSFQIKKAIEKNNTRQVLKESYSLLTSLRTSDLSPKYYYQLYTQAFDEMQYIENYFREDINRGRKLKDLYDSVQQAQTLIPRMYLLITVGSIYMDLVPKCIKKVIFDLLSMVKGIQDPIRGLFVRYYLLKMIKDKFPDKNNKYAIGGGDYNDSIKFILLNLDEMNRLWIRLKNVKNENEKEKREKERKELKLLIGENINRLASLESLNEEIYTNKVLPTIIKIIKENKDNLSQQYLMECIIFAFPDEYNIKSLESILECIENISENVNVNSLYINLMEKLSKYVGRNEDENKEELNMNIEKVYNLLKEHINKILNNEIAKDNINIINLLDLLKSFMNFAVKCCPIQEKVQSVNYILKISNDSLMKYKGNFNKKEIELIRKILCIPLDSNDINIFELNNFIELIKFLDFDNKNNLSQEIIENFIKNKKGKIDTVEKALTLINLIRPVLENNENIDTNSFEFELQQLSVSKLIYVIENKSPEILYGIYKEFENVYKNGGDKRKYYTFPSLSYCIINLIYKIILSFDNKNNYIDDNLKTPIFYDDINSINIDDINNNEEFNQILNKFYSLLNDICDNYININNVFVFNLYVDICIQLNSIKSRDNEIFNLCNNYTNKIIDIIEKENDQEKKLKMFNKFLGSLFNYNLFQNEQLNEIINKLIQISKEFKNKNECCTSILSISTIYFNYLNDKNNCLECLKQAKKYAKYTMTNPKNLYLYIDILNKYLYFIEKDNEDFIQKEELEDLFETINNHIDTIKNEGNNELNLFNFISYYNRILYYIQKKKEEGNKNIYVNLSEIKLQEEV